jgi:hypothetical protein
MSTRVVAALAGLISSTVLMAGPLDAYAADLADGYRPVLPKASAYRAARTICVGEYGPDAPPYGFGCLDHWVKVRSTHELVQDNGYAYTVTEENVRRRYPPQVYVPDYEVLNPYESGYAVFGQRLFLGCSLCD